MIILATECELVVADYIRTDTLPSNYDKNLSGNKSRFNLITILLLTHKKNLQKQPDGEN
jgi:hypothetical protein